MKVGLPGALSNTNMLGIPAGARKFSLGKHLARWFPGSFPGSTDGKCWVCINGVQMGSMFGYCQRVNTHIWVSLHLVLVGIKHFQILFAKEAIVVATLPNCSRCSVWFVEVTVDGGIKAFSLSQRCKHFCYFVIPLLRCSLPYPVPTTALTCVLRCFPCEPTWAGSPFLHRPPTPPMVRMTRSKTFQAYLPSCHRTYSCIHCRAHLANHDELISKVSVHKVAKCFPLEGCRTLLLI